jgi:hypothetical protein
LLLGLFGSDALGVQRPQPSGAFMWRANIEQRTYDLDHRRENDALCMVCVRLCVASVSHAE